MKKSSLFFCLLASYSAGAVEVCAVQPWDKDGSHQYPYFTADCTEGSASIDFQAKKKVQDIIKILSQQGYEVKVGDLINGLVFVKP
jgi:hypothetical protein